MQVKIVSGLESQKILGEYICCINIFLSHLKAFSVYDIRRKYASTLEQMVRLFNTLLPKRLIYNDNCQVLDQNRSPVCLNMSFTQTVAYLRHVSTFGIS
jgi:hypothetical protein